MRLHLNGYLKKTDLRYFQLSKFNHHATILDSGKPQPYLPYVVSCPNQKYPITLLFKIYL